MFLGFNLGVTVVGSRLGPGLSVSATSFVEQGAQAADILTFSRLNAKNPTAVSISSVSPAGVLQMNADGVTLEYGATTIVYTTNSLVSFTASFSDDNGGPYNFAILLQVTQIPAPAGGDLDLTFTVPPDEDPPVLSSPTATNAGSTGYSGTVSASELGTMHFVIYASTATVPTGDQIEAGLNGDGGAAVVSGAQDVTSSGTQNINGTGLTAATTYQIAYVMRDNANLQSNVSESSNFTTAASASVPSKMDAPTVTTTATRATVTFAADPADGGSAITGYDTRYSTNGGGAWTTVTGTTSGHVITGLTPGAANVEFQTRAVNAVGNGTWSDSYTISMKVITFLGFTANSGGAATYDIDLTTLDTSTGGAGGALQQDDVGIYACGWSASNGDGNPGISGWTELDELYGNDETRDINVSFGWKAMGASPDTAATVTGANNSTDGSCGVITWWRYVNPTSPIDVAGTALTGKDAALADPPSITPTATGAVVLECVGASGDSTPTDLVQSTGFTLAGRRKNGGSNRGARYLIAYQTWTSGAVDPGAITSTESTTGDSWGANTYSLKPY